MGKYLDLVALSTVTDVMPLVGINRHVLKYGLRKINTMQHPFFKYLEQFSVTERLFQIELNF
jgi:single-stranded DNA-specific DHH superfamily exonuclease